MQLQAVRDSFPITLESAYFNVAATAPLCAPVVQAIERYTDGVAREGAGRYTEWCSVANATRELAARLLAVEMDEIALIRNTSEGMNIVANGLRLGPGDSVLLVHGDFPANVHPWLRCREDGAEVRFVRPDRMNRIDPEQIVSACDDTTRIVSVSWVSFSNGFRMDLAGLGRALRQRGILLFVDAIQGLGVLPVRNLREHADFVSADAHKWLLAPEGIGLFWVRREVLERLEMTFVSWLSMENPFENDRYEGPLLPDARRFEYATPNTIGIHALHAALKLILDVGLEAIEQHALRLTDRLAQGLEQRGYLVTSPRGEAERSGIIAFQKDGTSSRELCAILRDRGVVTAHRAGGVRASAHLYNDDADVDRLLEALPR